MFRFEINAEGLLLRLPGLSLVAFNSFLLSDGSTLPGRAFLALQFPGGLALRFDTGA